VKGTVTCSDASKAGVSDNPSSADATSLASRQRASRTGSALRVSQRTDATLAKYRPMIAAAMLAQSRPSQSAVDRVGALWVRSTAPKVAGGVSPVDVEWLATPGLGLNRGIGRDGGTLGDEGNIAEGD